MSLFIATIFIAELVIALALIGFIIKVDRKVCLLNNEVIKFMPTLVNGIDLAKSIIKNLKITLHSMFCFVEKKKKQYTFKIAQTLILYFILIFFRGKYKKAAAIFHLLVLTKDYMDKLPFNACNS